MVWKGLEKHAKNNIILQALELYKDILNGEKVRRLSDESDDSSRLSNVFDIYEKIIVIWKQDETRYYMIYYYI